MQPGNFTFDPFVPWWILLGIACLLFWVVGRAYSRSTRPLSFLKKVLLGSLRFLAFSILLLCLMRPVMVRHHQLHEKSLGFVGLDSSSSMNLRDMPKNETRWEAARQLIQSNRESLQRLTDQFELHRYLFDGSAHEIAELPGEERATPSSKVPPMLPIGTSTDIVALLEKVTLEGSGNAGGGLLLFSDGRQNIPKDALVAALNLGRAGIPIFAVGLGQEATPNDFKDIRIRDLIVPERAFIGAHMTLQLEIESTLPAPKRVPLSVEINGKKIYEKMVEMPAGANVPCPVIEIPYVPDALGIHRVIANLGVLPGEADVNNNVRSAFFRVYKTKLGIWYVEGSIRKEFGAIRSAIETAPNVSFKALNAFMTQTGTHDELLPMKGEERDQLRLVIIGDLPAERFDLGQLKELAKFVEEGGAVLMIGGVSNFGAGGWQFSPLAPVFPVEMSDRDGMQDGSLRIQIPEEEATHPVLMLADTRERSLEAWKLLPPLPGINRISRVHPAAHVLLRAGSGELLAVQEYGRGRSAVFMADMTWQWILKANQGESHKRFWRNLVTWLTRSDYRDTDKAVFADSERLQYQVGEDVLLRAFVNETEKSAAKIKDAGISFSLTRIEGSTETQVLKEDVGRGIGEHLKHFAVGIPGTYRFKASANAADGSVIDSDSLDLQVTGLDVENDNPRANLKLLRRIASISGGTYFDPEKAADAFQALLRRQAAYSKDVTDVSELWNDPWMLMAFVTLLSIEWMLRKKWGLI